MRLGFVALLTVGCMVEVLWVHHVGAWLLGAGTVMCSLGYAIFSSWAPAHIENWKTGADAERRTEKTLRALERDGWETVHDLHTPFGNIDHVVVGPGGIFVLDTKQPQGHASVDGELVRVSRRANPRGAYTETKMASSARGAAWGLSREIADVLGRSPWVTAAIVLWSPFEQRHRVEHETVGCRPGRRRCDAELVVAVAGAGAQQVHPVGFASQAIDSASGTYDGELRLP